VAKKVEIMVEIGVDGEVTLDVNGVKGKGCVDLTASIEEILGEVTERKYSSEYYQAEENVHRTIKRTT
jgi:hypothetical protein